MKKVSSFILILINILLLISCEKTITINIKSDIFDSISYKIEKKELYSISDLKEFNNEDYIFLGYSFNNKELIKKDTEFILNDNDTIYACFGISKDFFNIKSIGKVSIESSDKIDTKEEYRNAQLEIVKDDYYLKRDVLIKLRGNSTLWVDKKSYKLKFSEKENIMNMGSDKEWALLANYFDPTHLRNYYAYKMAIAVGLEYSIDLEFVEVYLNEEYQGLYLLTETVKTAKERVNIEDENYSFLLELDEKLIQDNPNYEDTIGDEMFLLDNYPYGKVYAFGCKYPKSFKDISVTEYEYIIEFMNTVFKSVRSHTFYDYIDIESFINYYLIQELFMNVDVDYSSVYMYKGKSGKLSFGPIWDFDLSSGNVSYVNNYNPNSFMKNINGGSYLFETALKNDKFRIEVKNRLDELNKDIIPLMINSIGLNMTKLASYAKLDNNKWNVLADHNWARPEHLVNISYEEQVAYFKYFVSEHNKFMLANY